MTDKEMYHALRVLPSLAPSKEVNALFSSLVLFTESGGSITLHKLEIEEIQKLCAKAESEIEFFYAQKILASKDYEETLKEFPYYENYEKLCELEHKNLLFCSGREKVNNLLFIGGGPLPMTAIFLARNYGAHVTVLEKDRNAVTLSKEIISVLDLSSLVAIVEIDALSFYQYQTFDAIFLAALVGEGDEEKEVIISHVYKQMKEKSLLLLRSAFGARELLYAPVREIYLTNLPVLLEVRPYKNICNSFFIIQKT